MVQKINTIIKDSVISAIFFVAIFFALNSLENTKLISSTPEAKQATIDTKEGIIGLGIGGGGSIAILIYSLCKKEKRDFYMRGP